MSIIEGLREKQRSNGLFLKSPEKGFLKLKSACYEVWIFEHVFKTLENKTIAKLHDLKRFPFEDTKRFMSTEIGPKSFGTFEKRPPSEFSVHVIVTMQNFGQISCVKRNLSYRITYFKVFKKKEKFDHIG